MIGGKSDTCGMGRLRRLRLMLNLCFLTMLVFVLCDVFRSSKWTLTRYTAPSCTWPSIIRSTTINCSELNSGKEVRTFSGRLCFQHSRPENISTEGTISPEPPDRDAKGALPRNNETSSSRRLGGTSLDSGWRGIYWRDFVEHCRPKPPSETFVAKEKRAEIDEPIVSATHPRGREKGDDELQNLQCDDHLPKRRCGPEKRPVYLCVHPYGRLGNQMFSYASSLGVAVRYNLTLVIDPSLYVISFKSVFKIAAKIDWNLEICGDAQDRAEAWGGGTFWPNLMYAGKTCGRVQVLLYYLQSWRYFEHVKDAVKREFKFTGKIHAKAERILLQIRKTGCLLQTAAAESGSSPQETTSNDQTSSSNITVKNQTFVSSLTFKSQTSVSNLADTVENSSSPPKSGQNITQQNMVCVNFTGNITIRNGGMVYYSDKMVNSSVVSRNGQNMTQPNHGRTPGASLTLVGLHVRHKDITEEKKFIDHGYQVPPISYYKRAMQHFMLNFSNVVFVIATDDAIYVKKDVIPVCIVIGARCQLIQETAEVDMAVLAGCDHVIMSVGTFGWWAAWMAGGHVVYYKNPARPGTKMRFLMNYNDFYPPTWLGLE